MQGGPDAPPAAQKKGTRGGSKRRQASALTDSSDGGQGRGAMDEGVAFDVKHSEGNTFRSMGQYKKAINSYTKVGR